MSEPEELMTWTTGPGTTYTLPTTPTWTTTSTPWSASADPEMIRAWVGAVIERLEYLQQRIRELEARQSGR